MDSLPKRSKTGGRQKGGLNRTTATAKENIIAVFTRLGSTAAMADWARENRTEFYKLYGRLLPVEQHVSGELGTYTAQPIPVEQRNTDSLESPARPTNGHSAG